MCRIVFEPIDFIARLAALVGGGQVRVGVNRLALTAFVGVNLLQSGFTKWCLMENIMRTLGASAGN